MSQFLTRQVNLTVNRLGFFILMTATAASVGCSGRSSADANQADVQNSPLPSLSVSVSSTAASTLPADGERVGGEAASKQVRLSLTEFDGGPTDHDNQRIDASQTFEERLAQNRRSVSAATTVLRTTLNRREHKEEFDAAIRQLLRARFELALSGTQADVDRLYADVQALNSRDPQANATAEGLYTLAVFCHAKALRVPSNAAAWLMDFSRWAREFATRFPVQEQRAAGLVSAAASCCELRAQTAANAATASGLRAEAKACYAVLIEAFADTVPGREAAAVMRRLNLPGKKLSQFGGPTLDGSYVSEHDFVGVVTCVYFYNSTSGLFENTIAPHLREFAATTSSLLQFVGVCLDVDEAVARNFGRTHDLPGRQIFFAEPSLRSWDNPLVRFWGVSRIPSLWLVDADGVVARVDVSIDRFAGELRKLTPPGS